MNSDPGSKYKVGDVVRLVKMGPDPDPIPEGTKGEVKHVQYIPMWRETHLMVAWENNRYLGVVLSEDQVTDEVELV